MTAPAVSVVMTVYDGIDYLLQAMDSILSQTFHDFEFIVVDDGSTDGSADLIERYSDPRIQLIRSEHEGLVHALNLGLANAQGRYVARMDADDVAHSERLAVQVDYLENHPEVGLVCTDIQVIDEAGKTLATQREQGLNNDSLREGLLFRRKMKPVIHPSIMMRHEVVEAIRGYRQFEYAEDHDFWLRAIDQFGFARLERELLFYRIHSESVSRTKGSKQALSSAMAAVTYQVRRRTGIDIFDDQPDLFKFASEIMAKRLQNEVLKPSFAFRNAKIHFLLGRTFLACLIFSLALLRYGYHALPDSARFRTRKIVDDVAAAVIRNII